MSDQRKDLESQRDRLWSEAHRLAHESEAAWKVAANNNPWFESSKDGGSSIASAREVDARFNRVTEALDRVRDQLEES